jgi:hypothetical protein
MLRPGSLIAESETELGGTNVAAARIGQLGKSCVLAAPDCPDRCRALGEHGKTGRGLPLTRKDFDSAFPAPSLHLVASGGKRIGTRR